MSSEAREDLPSPGAEEIEINKNKMEGLSHTATGVTISPELFEKLYLTPKTPHADDSYKKFANITPLGLVGFVISTYTFAMILMGWGGSSGFYGELGIFYFVAPLLLTISFICEWIMGNFFSMMVMGMFSVFWLSFGLVNTPTLGLQAAYSKTGDAAAGALNPEYTAGIGLFLVVWGAAFFTYFIFTLKTNCIFAGIFFFATIAIWILSGAYFRLSTGDYTTAGHLQKAGGACLFVVATLGWYITFVIMSIEMRMPFNLPVGDLSRFWPSSNVPITDSEKQD